MLSRPELLWKAFEICIFKLIWTFIFSLRLFDKSWSSLISDEQREISLVMQRLTDTGGSARIRIRRISQMRSYIGPGTKFQRFRASTSHFLLTFAPVCLEDAKPRRCGLPPPPSLQRGKLEPSPPTGVGEGGKFRKRNRKVQRWSSGHQISRVPSVGYTARRAFVLRGLYTELGRSELLLFSKLLARE